MESTGLIKGVDAENFGIETNLTREQMAVIFGRALYYRREDMDVKLITGYPDGTFRPDDPVSREEAVVIFNRFFGNTAENRNSLGLPAVPDVDTGFTDIEGH